MTVKPSQHALLRLGSPIRDGHLTEFEPVDDFAAGVLVNLVSAVFVFVFVWAFLFASRRSRLVDFFHVRKQGITLYSSTLNVKRGGSVGADGIPRSFFGAALPRAEAEVLADVQRLLSTYAFGSQSILRSLRFVDVDYISEASPATTAEVARDRTLLTLGSPGYNEASRFVESEFDPLGRFHPSNGGLLVAGAPPMNSLSGMLVRAIHPTTGQVAFYAAGPSEPSTVAAAKYLLNHWRTLARQYPGTRPFCVVVQADLIGGSMSIFQTPEPVRAPWQVLTCRIGRH